MSDPEWSPTWAIPLIHSKLSLLDILKKGNNIFVEDSLTHMLTLEYAARLFSENAQQFFLIPDQKIIKFESSALFIIVLPFDSVINEFSTPYSFSLAQEGQRLDSILVKSALMKINIFSQINHKAKVSISIPNATKNGKMFKTTLALDYSGTLPVENNVNLDFSGFNILLDNSPGHTNEINANIRIAVYGDSNPNLSPYTFSAKCDLVNIKFSKLFGFLGKYEFPLVDTLTLSLFKNSIQGGIHLEEIDMFMKTSNSIGMPIELNFLDLLAFSAKNPPYTVDIADHPLFPNPLVIPSPDINHIGIKIDTTFQFGENNSNIIDAINMSPEYIYFNVIGKSNPANNGAYQNFILDTSRLAVDLKLKLPLFGSISGFFIEDTVNFNFDIPSQAKMVEFKVRTLNHFPLDAELQIYFADQNYKILDSLFSGKNHNIIVAAPVSGPPDYRVIDKPPIEPFIFSPDPFLAADLERLRQSKFLLIKAKMSTYKSDLVKIYVDDWLDVQMAAKLQFGTQN
ncbi:MAG: hypothetical protein WCK84_03660 [Bacteroidota bacterium]